MYRSVFKPLTLTFALALASGASLSAQSASKIISSEIAISRERAEIKLELDNGNKATIATALDAPAGLRRGGAAGHDVFTLGVQRGDAVDRSWRELLNKAMEAQTSDLGSMLRDWQSPAASGKELDGILESVLSSTTAATAVAAPAAPVAPGMNDSVTKLEDRIQELQDQLNDARSDAVSATRHRRGPDWLAPLRHVGRGISGIFATLVTYAVLFGLGFATIMFGGRKYIEGVADTVRRGIGRSFLVGLAGSFLVLPVFVLGIIALAISIVGIPALLIWIPLFPIGTLLAVTLGFIGVAHAGGESWTERRYYASEWFSRANSYYFIAAGLALLSSLFIAAQVISMAGPWLGFINHILTFLGVVLTWASATIGFGAVLISRGGSRLNGSPLSPDEAAYESADV